LYTNAQRRASLTRKHSVREEILRHQSGIAEQCYQPVPITLHLANPCPNVTFLFPPVHQIVNPKIDMLWSQIATGAINNYLLLGQFINR